MLSQNVLMKLYRLFDVLNIPVCDITVLNTCKYTVRILFMYVITLFVHAVTLLMHVITVFIHVVTDLMLCDHIIYACGHCKDACDHIIYACGQSLLLYM